MIAKARIRHSQWEAEQSNILITQKLRKDFKNMASIEKRHNKSGKIIYRAVVRVSGFPHQYQSFAKKSDALAWANRTESDLRLNRGLPDAVAKKHTMGKLIDRYIENILNRKSKKIRYVATQHSQFKWWKKEIGHYRLSNITPYVLTDAREKLLRSGKKPATANRYMAALSHLFTICVKEWGLLSANPITNKIDKLKEPRGRVRFLSDAERERLLEYCKEYKSKPMHLIVVLAISTGSRKMELLSSRWEDLDLERGLLTIHDTKNGERRPMYISGKAKELLAEYQQGKKEGYIFPSRNKKQPLNINVDWKEIITAARIKDFRFHDLRHTCASYLAMNGASSTEIAEVLGHKTLDMVKRYAHLSQGHTAEVVKGMNEKYFN
jgi:integrase